MVMGALLHSCFNGLTHTAACVTCPFGFIGVFLIDNFIEWHAVSAGSLLWRSLSKVIDSIRMYLIFTDLLLQPRGE